MSSAWGRSSGAPGRRLRGRRKAAVRRRGRLAPAGNGRPGGAFDFGSQAGSGPGRRRPVIVVTGGGQRRAGLDAQHRRGMGPGRALIGRLGVGLGASLGFGRAGTHSGNDAAVNATAVTVPVPRCAHQIEDHQQHDQPASPVLHGSRRRDVQGDQGAGGGRTHADERAKTRPRHYSLHSHRRLRSRTQMTER